MVKLSELKIEPVTLEHLTDLLELDQACFDGLWTIEGYRQEIENISSHFLGLFSLIPSHDLLGIGCFWSVLEEAHITILAVHPEYQGQGLGQALLYSLIKDAVDMGLERATLEVRVSNAPAISLYKKFGWKTAGIRPRYYQDNQEDGLILWISQLQHPHFLQTLEKWHVLVQDRLRQFSWLLIQDEN